MSSQRKDLKKVQNCEWHRHPNGGGWVAETADVDETAFVGQDALVYGLAKVRIQARIQDVARVYGASYVGDYAVVAGGTHVRDNAHVRGRARLGGRGTIIEGRATVSGNAVIFNSRAGGNAYVDQDARLFDGSAAIGSAKVSGWATLCMSTVRDHVQVYGFAVLELVHLKGDVHATSGEVGYTEIRAVTDGSTLKLDL